MVDEPPSGGVPSSAGPFSTIVTEAPTPSERSKAVLVVTSGNDVGRVISLVDAVTLGRSEECGARLHDDSLSRVHAQVVRVVGNWMLADKASTNGTYLNGRQLKTAERLKMADLIRIGDTEYRYRE